MAKANSQLSTSPLFNQSLEKGLSVICAFSDGRRDLNLPEIAEAAGITKSTAQRLAYTLEKLGYLRKDSKTKRFSLSPKCVELGFGYIQNSWLVNHANSFLLDLNGKYGETVNLSVADDTSMVFISRFTSHKYMATHMSIGSRLPMFCTASGRAYLAALPENEAEELLQRCKMQRYTSKTVTDIDQIRDMLTEIRETGVAWANEEYYQGDISISAAVKNMSGHPIGVVNVSLPSSRWTLNDGIEQISKSLLETALAISIPSP